MKKVEKLIMRLLANPTPSEMSAEDVKMILEFEGWWLDRSTGSHFIFKNDGGTIVLPIHHGVIKKTYLKNEIINKLNLEEKYGKDK